MVVVKSKEQQLREACSYTFDLFNAGCGSGRLVEGGYLRETLKGKVVQHGVALYPDVTDIGARTYNFDHGYFWTCKPPPPTVLLHLAIHNQQTGGHITGSQVIVMNEHFSIFLFISLIYHHKRT